MNHSNKFPSISFHVYHLIARFTVHVRHPIEEKNKIQLCLQDLDTVSPAKLYTRKQIVMMETSIVDSHTSFYIPEE